MSIAVESLLTPAINRPARYLGNELGAVHKPWDDAIVHWALTYPEVYEVGSSNLGHIILYSILNVQPRQLCDRAYLPAADLSDKLKATETPLFGVESRRSLQEFDILGFSLSYELSATNILEMLLLCRIDSTWAERGAMDLAPWQGGGAPFIFAGGQTATSNPEPYADFFDFVALGDGEELLPEVGLILEEAKLANLGRRETLLDLAQVPGIYVPQFYERGEDGAVHPLRSDVPERILRRVATPIPAYAIGLVPYVETVHDRLTVEIRRGCTRGCRFCQPGMLTRPARDVEPEAVVAAVEKGMRATGYNEFSLLSLSCSDYLALPAVGLEIKNRLQSDNISLTLPSQRVDRFDENIANIIGGTRQGGLTFAPEAGTQRLRDIINKGLTNEELLRGIKTAQAQGWNKIKLYFMIGLPGETDADILGIAETLRWLQWECRAQGRKILSFNLTISNFTPKPHTPFQWHSVSTDEFRRKQRLLRAELATLRGLKINFTDVRISAMEDFVGRGDRRLSAVIRRAWELGAGLDAWWENQDQAYGAWTQAIAEAGLTWEYQTIEQGEWAIPVPGGSANGGTEEPDNGLDLLTADKPNDGLDLLAADRQDECDSSLLPTAYSPIPLSTLDRPLPWDHIDSGIDKQWLKDDLLRALEAATVPDCSFDGCSHCGVCGLDFGTNVTIAAPVIPAFAGHFKPNTDRLQRLRIRFGKQGDMALISHLDLLRLFDRAIRRAALPIAFSGGFHPSPRIIPANALSLGMTSCGELIDFELTTVLDPAEFRDRLAAQLPEDLPLYEVEVAGVKEPAVAQRLARAEYLLRIGPGVAPEIAPEVEPNVGLETGASIDRTDWSPETWQSRIDQLLAQDELWIDHTSKSGKTQPLNLRDRLHTLHLADPDLAQAHLKPAPPNEPSITLQYIGSSRNDGTLLRPEQLVTLLEALHGPHPSGPLQLHQVHRHRLYLDPIAPPPPPKEPSRLDNLLEQGPIGLLNGPIDAPT